MIPGIKKKVWLADAFAAHLLRQKGPDPHGLCAVLVATLNLYTQDSTVPGAAVYECVNAVLRAEDRDLVKPFFPLLHLLLKAFALLPKHRKKLWRGVKLDIKQYYQEGANVVWWPITSCTSDAKVLTTAKFLGQTGPRTLFSVMACGAMDVSRYSSYAVEKEFLLAPGSTLRVVSLLPQGDLTIIDAEELDQGFLLVE